MLLHQDVAVLGGQGCSLADVLALLEHRGELPSGMLRDSGVCVLASHKTIQASALQSLCHTWQSGPHMHMCPHTVMEVDTNSGAGVLLQIAGVTHALVACQV